MPTKCLYPDWTLFLDRDGVINQHPKSHYVFDWNGFNFIPGVLEAIPKLNLLFSRIIIVTNQQGIGKKDMTVEDLSLIHEKMMHCIHTYDGNIDLIQYCSDLITNSDHGRKPRPNMALDAMKIFPKINFNKSIMMGDQITDMEFGRNLGMKTILIHNRSAQKPLIDESLYDYAFENLWDCSIFLDQHHEEIFSN